MWMFFHAAQYENTGEAAGRSTKSGVLVRWDTAMPMEGARL
jgi:hypothetical protein